ncbi:copper-binding protein [Amycolatopsis antarctica]|uniref:Copper-binding protein n=1 Tax=Amycolatopsis antarctica TaxID=1854586 RepID=A0A263D3S4_9PSEU|nr:plastocyanin/azurin family copper-binding protein [Amycolatopsis antarctica]OZM72106.1 copper-binding protein [Amycolatopsis antarctica]
MSRSLVAALAAALTMLGLVLAPVSVSANTGTANTEAAAQVLTWTAGNSVTEYTSAPTEAVAGETTIVFENSEATGNTTSMPHTLTFDTTTPGYNHDVDTDLLANPSDANGGRHETTVTLTPGKYRYYCAIPGHLQMTGEFVVTEDGGGGEDTTPPTVSAEAAGEQDADGNYIGSASVTVNATDQGSGVDSVEYQLDGGEFLPYSEPVVVDSVGEHMVHFRATDVAGNVSEEGMLSFAVVEGDAGDVTPPTVSAEVTGNQDGEGNYLDAATVAITAQDEGSGVDSVEYQLDGGEFLPYSEPVVVDSVGEHMVHFRATDVAGNVSEEGMSSFAVVEGPDIEGPTVTAVVSGDQNANWEYLGRAFLSLSAVDDKSEVAVLEYALDGGTWTSYTKPVMVNTLGKHIVRYRAFDSEGNASEQSSGSFTIVAAGSAAVHTRAVRVL